MKISLYKNHLSQSPTQIIFKKADINKFIKSYGTPCTLWEIVNGRKEYLSTIYKLEAIEAYLDITSLERPIYIEKLLLNGRYYDIQVISDQIGNHIIGPIKEYSPEDKGNIQAKFSELSIEEENRIIWHVKKTLNCIGQNFGFSSLQIKMFGSQVEVTSINFCLKNTHCIEEFCKLEICSVT